MATFDKDFGDATLEASFGNTQQGVNEMCNIVTEMRDSMCTICRYLDVYTEDLCKVCYYRREKKNG